ncbi:MAG: hypothetical protein HPY58_08030 [Firmicutes bacterium]|nr:hypothetical protein [Bacillota bacterium]
MESGCPVCNGLTQLAEDCPACGAPMEDCGSVESYCDPYGPYEEQENGKTAEGSAYTGDDQCIHFLQCPNCDESITLAVGRDAV